MTHTRYTSTNILLLVAGGIACAVVVFLCVMTAGFGADPAHDFRSGAIICFLCLALLSAPAYLTMFRWCGVGEITMWSVTGMSFAVLLVAGVLLHFLGFVVLLGRVCAGV